jgi:hypothetical protein
LLHGVYLYRQIAARAPNGGAGLNIRGLYYGVWTFALWTIFGSYALALWLVGAVTLSLIRLIPTRRSA